MNVRTETCGSPSWMEVQLFTAVFDGFIWRKRAYKRSKIPRCYRNPIALAQEWRALMSEESLTQADLARRLRVSRARVTQVMNLLDLDPKVAAAIVALGDPLPRRVATERALRPFVDLPLEEQTTKVGQVVQRAKERLRFAVRKEQGTAG